MSDDAPSPRIDPEVAGRREFTRSRKGFDTLEVKAHILEMAGEISRLASVETELRRELAAAQRAVEDHESLDPAILTRVLGEETARVLETARAAAADIESKAEASAADLIADAQEKAARLTGDAADLRSAAARDAESLVETATAEAETLVSEARAEAEETRAAAEASGAELRARAETILAERTAEADAEAERIRTAAHELRDEADEHVARLKEEAESSAAAVTTAAETSAAELVAAAEEDATATREAAEADAARTAEEAAAVADEVVEAARERGRQMVTEARDARERMLRDLAERRAEARRQLEALRAGRERLLESFSATRAAFDLAGDELDGALGAARVAADDAARSVEDDLDAALFELDDEIAGGVGPLSELDAGDATALDDEEFDDDAEEDGVSGDPESVATVIDLESVERETDDAEEEDEDDLIAEHAFEDDEDDVDDDAESSDDGGTEASGGRSGGSHLRLVGDESSDIGDGSGGDADDAEEIFARLRANEHTDDPVVSEEASASAVAVETRVEIVDEDADEESDDELEEEPVSEAQALLDRRDAQLGDLERVVGRRCKRTLADMENAVLDRIRRSKKTPAVDTVLDGADDEVAAFVDAVREELANAVEAGVSFVGEFDVEAVVPDVDGVVATVVEEVDERLAGPLRSRLVRTIEGSDGDADELAESVRSTYRQFRSEQLDGSAGDLVTSAFNRGVLAAMGPDHACTWAIDHQGLPCADAEDNQLAGPVGAGDEYPTGVVTPPAHPGCRCLLVPVTQ